jgi:hypothetical protein
MKKSRKLLVFVCLGLFVCAFVWLFTHEFTRSYPASVVTVQVLPRKSASEPFKLRFTNTDRKPVEVRGVLVEEKLSGQWVETTNLAFHGTMQVNMTGDISAPYLASNHVYRARVTCWQETTGLRLVTIRIRQALKRHLDSGTPYHWTEGVSDELRP